MFTDELRADTLALLDWAEPIKHHVPGMPERIARLRAALELATNGVPVVDCDGETEVFERVEDAEAFADAMNEADGTDGYEVETQWSPTWPPEGIHDAESAADLIAQAGK